MRLIKGCTKQSVAAERDREKTFISADIQVFDTAIAAVTPNAYRNFSSAFFYQILILNNTKKKPFADCNGLQQCDHGHLSNRAQTERRLQDS